jgi:hypothetical protein
MASIRSMKAASALGLRGLRVAGCLTEEVMGASGAPVWIGPSAAGDAGTKTALCCSGCEAGRRGRAPGALGAPGGPGACGGPAPCELWEGLLVPGGRLGALFSAAATMVCHVLWNQERSSRVATEAASQ